MHKILSHCSSWLNSLHKITTFIHFHSANGLHEMKIRNCFVSHTALTAQSLTACLSVSQSASQSVCVHKHMHVCTTYLVLFTFIPKIDKFVGCVHVCYSCGALKYTCVWEINCRQRTNSYKSKAKITNYIDVFQFDNEKNCNRQKRISKYEKVLTEKQSNKAKYLEYAVQSIHKSVCALFGVVLLLIMGVLLVKPNIASGCIQ